MLSEKREFDRLNINIPIKYKVVGKNSIYQTIMHDISDGGMRLMSKIFIPRSKKIVFELNLLKLRKTIVSAGELVWIRSHRYGNGFYEVGIKFNGLTDYQRKYLQYFINKYYNFL